MKDFSLFEHALKIAGTRLENLGDVPHISRREFDARETLSFRARVPCLEYATLLIENRLTLRARRGGRVYAGFERLSRMEPVVERYLRIADISERLYAFGEPDWEPPTHPNLRVVRLSPQARLAREWFIVADSPAVRAALVALDEGPSPSHAHDEEQRFFRAFKTCDPELVTRLAAAADDLAYPSLVSTRLAS